MAQILVTAACDKPRFQVLGSYIPMTTTNAVPSGQPYVTANNSTYVLNPYPASSSTNPGLKAVTLTEAANKPRANVLGSYIPMSQVNQTSAGRKYYETNNSTYLIESYVTGSQSASATFLTSAADSAGLSSTTALTRASTSDTSYLTRASTSNTVYGTRASTSATIYGTRASTSGTNYGTLNSAIGTEYYNSGYFQVAAPGYYTHYYFTYTGTATSTGNPAMSNIRNASGTFTAYEAVNSGVVGSSYTLTKADLCSGDIYGSPITYQSISFKYRAAYQTKTTGTTYLTRASTSGTTYYTRQSTSGTTYLTRSSTSGTSYLTRASTSGYSGVSSSSSSKSSGEWI